MPIHALRLLTVFLSILLAGALTEANAEKTLRGRLRPKAVGTTSVEKKVQKIRFDTIAVTSQADIRLSGYDKPLNSRKESMFVSNKLPCRIVGLNIRLSYSDMSGHTLHEEVIDLHDDIPAGATRRVEFPSWDRQNSFYYYRGRQPRVANVTPYRVTCMVISYITMTDLADGPNETELTSKP